MGFIKEMIKKTPAYSELFFGFYLWEKVRMNYRTKSFAEYQEDLKIQKLIGNVDSFVDIGANDGYHSSNSFYWALRGARGVCFEPLSEAYRQLRRLYLFNRRVTCRNVGISDKVGETAIVSLGVLSYIPQTQDENHRALHEQFHKGPRRERKVKVLRFDDAIQGLGLPKSIDLLSVDVEGHELNVLQSIPFDSYSFRVIIVETHELNGSGEYVWRHRDLDQINELLALNGYKPVFRTFGNTLYTQAEAGFRQNSTGPALFSKTRT